MWTLKDCYTEHRRSIFYLKMGETANNNAQNTADYLAQLLKDKKQLAAFPNVFLHLERLLDDGKLIKNFVLD